MYEAKRWNTDSRFICPMVSRGDIDIFVGDVVFYQYPGNPIPHGLGLVLKIYKRVSFVYYTTLIPDADTTLKLYSVTGGYSYCQIESVEH